MSTMFRDKYDGLIRFDSLNEDFIKTLKNIGVIPKRNLPIYNKTETKKKYLGSYKGNEVKILGLEKCLVFMSIWGYEIPK